MDELLTQIFELAIKVNRETEKAVFVDYSGHVHLFEISIRKSKRKYLDFEYRNSCYIDAEWECWEKEAMTVLTEMRNVLCGLLKKGKEVEE